MAVLTTSSLLNICSANAIQDTTRSIWYFYHYPRYNFSLSRIQLLIIQDKTSHYPGHSISLSRIKLLIIQDTTSHYPGYNFSLSRTQQGQSDICFIASHSPPQTSLMPCLIVSRLLCYGWGCGGIPKMRGLSMFPLILT